MTAPPTQGDLRLHERRAPEAYANPPSLTAMLVLAAMIVLASIVTPIYALLGLMPLRDFATKPWLAAVEEVIRPAALAPAPQPTSVRLRIVEPPQIDDASDALRHAWLVRVAIHNDTRARRVLRWDLSRAPLLQLPDGRILKPIGQKLPWLAPFALAVSGVLDVEAPAGGTCELYPVYSIDAVPAGSRPLMRGIESVVVGRWGMPR